MQVWIIFAEQTCIYTDSMRCAHTLQLFALMDSAIFLAAKDKPPQHIVF